MKTTKFRQHRVEAFCDWLDTIPPQPPFHERAEFRFYADLSDAEIDAGAKEMRRRGSLAFAASERLTAFASAKLPAKLNDLASELGTPDDWAWSAVEYLKGMLSPSQGGDLGGSVEVSTAAIGVLLDYVERLAGEAGIIPSPLGRSE